MDQPAVTLENIRQARKRIAPIIFETPVLESMPLGRSCGIHVYLKLENTQQTTSFKIRGAANKLMSMTPEDRQKGVITVSSGNHGKAVAFVAKKLGIPAVVGLSVFVPENKVFDIQGYGAETMIAGNNWEETCAAAAIVAQKRDLIWINPFDDPAVINGQGSLALEVLERYPFIDTIVTPLSGGGLASGVALAAKAIHPHIRVIGVSHSEGACMYLSIRAGKEVEIIETPTLADALVGGIGPNNLYTLDLCSRLLDDTVLVTEDEIGQAMAFLLDRHHLVVEGAGAVTTAALLHHKARFGSHTLAIVSGGSVDTDLLIKAAEKYLPTLSEFTG